LDEKEINDSQREQVATDLAVLTSATKSLQAQDVKQATNILRKITSTSSLHKNVKNKVLVA